MKYNTQYALTVLIPSYNREEYLAEAIESVLKQKVNFKYQIVIADDCSTDSSLSIIKEYTDKYDFIFLDLAEKNKGMDNYIVHFCDVWKTLDTEYIALLGSDDYWIDENKLQAQYDILYNHKKFVVVFDSFFWFDYNTPEIHTNGVHLIPKFSHFSTVFFRNIIDIHQFPKVLREDGGFPYVFACYGKACYRDTLTSFYRKANSAVYSSMTPAVINHLATYTKCMILSFILSKRDQNIATFDKYLISEYLTHDILYIKEMLNTLKIIRNKDNYVGSTHYCFQEEDNEYLNVLEQDLLKHQQEIISTINKSQTIAENKKQK